MSENALVETMEEYKAVREDAGTFALPRDFLKVTGPDAVSWIQGQLSQDVAALAVGTAADSLLLQPQGKVDALVRVIRTGEQELVLDVDGGYGEAVLGRLQRFKIRIKAEIETLNWRCLAVRGPNAAAAATSASGGLVVVADWPGLRGIDVIGEAPAVAGSLRQCSLATWQTVRIEAGIPAMGAELTERTIPAEAGIVARTVSFTKGCYTGQELVARIDSRGGNVPRHLRGLVIATSTGTSEELVGAAVVQDDREIGIVTSVAPAGTGLGLVALAYVRRDVDPPAAAEVRWSGGTATARVENLPLVG